MSQLSKAIGIDIKVDEHGIRVRHVDDEIKAEVEHSLTDYISGAGVAAAIPVLEKAVSVDTAHVIAVEVADAINKALTAWINSL